MLYTGSGNLPNHIYCYVRTSFIRSNSNITYEPCIWFGLSSKPGHAWGCHILLECGAVYRNIPPHAITFTDNPKLLDWSITDAQLWDCYGLQFSTIRYDYLADLKAQTKLYSGRYLFTAIPIADSFTQEPTQSKEFKFIMLDNGNLTIQPTDKVLFTDASFTDNSKFPTNLKISNIKWRCE